MWQSIAAVHIEHRCIGVCVFSLVFGFISSLQQTYVSVQSGQTFHPPQVFMTCGLFFGFTLFNNFKEYYLIN